MTDAAKKSSAKQSIGANTLIFPNPVLVVGTYDANGKANAITLAWGGVASSGPEAISIAVRPSRYSIDALYERKAFTINLPSVKQAVYADYFGIASGRDVDKFAVSGLTPLRAEHVDAPIIAEFPYNMECKVTQHIDLGAHILFIGEVVDVQIDEKFATAGPNGMPSWEDAQLLSFDSLGRAYRSPGAVVAKAFDIGKQLL